MKTKFNLQTALMCLGFTATAIIVIGVSSCGKETWGKYRKHKQKDTLVHTDTTHKGGGGSDSTNGGGGNGGGGQDTTIGGGGNGGGGTDTTLGGGGNGGGGNQDSCYGNSQEKIASVGVTNGSQFNPNDSACFNIAVTGQNSGAKYAYIEEMFTSSSTNNEIHVYLIAKVYYKGCKCTTGTKSLTTTYCLQKRSYKTQHLHFQQPDGTYIDRTVKY